MKSNQAMVAVAVLAVVLLATLPKRLGGQAEKSQSQAAESPLAPTERELAAKKKALLSESSDLEAIVKSLRGGEFDAAMNLDRKATEGIMEIDATLWFLVVYDNMQCEPDREVAKAAVKNRLGFYSHLLGLHADSAAGYLAFAKLPATAQAGTRIRDDLRAAKDKLDEIAASLK